MRLANGSIRSPMYVFCSCYVLMLLLTPSQGTIPLVVNVGSADIIATLVTLKKEVEAKTGNTIKMTIAGATEAHLVADELAEANVGVIVTPTRSYVGRRYILRSS